MERLINPDGLAPEAAYQATSAALMEQIETRVDSVDKGEAYHARPPRHRHPDAQRPGDLRDHRPLGGLCDPVARHASA